MPINYTGPVFLLRGERGQEGVIIAENENGKILVQTMIDAVREKAAAQKRSEKKG